MTNFDYLKFYLEHKNAYNKLLEELELNSTDIHRFVFKVNNSNNPRDWWVETDDFFCFSDANYPSVYWYNLFTELGCNLGFLRNFYTDPASKEKPISPEEVFVLFLKKHRKFAAWKRKYRIYIDISLLASLYLVSGKTRLDTEWKNLCAHFNIDHNIDKKKALKLK